MQEEVENRTVNLAVTTTRMTARAILSGIRNDICKCRYCGEPVHNYKVAGRYLLS